MNRKQQAAKLAEDLQISAEELERAIIEIAASMKRLSEMRLQRKAIILLISDQTGLGKGVVQTVLSGMDDLERIWLKAK